MLRAHNGLKVGLIHASCSHNRLEIAMGSGCVPFAVSQRSSPTSDVATVAETLSALRLRYEETVVQLYSCQSRVSAILRDPAGSTQDAWADVRHKVAGALESTRNGGRDEELWSKAENLIDSLTNGKSSSGDTEASPSPVKQDHLAGQVKSPFVDLQSTASFGLRRGWVGERGLLLRVVVGTAIPHSYMRIAPQVVAR